MTREELLDDGIVVESALYLALDVGVFDFFVLLDNVLNLTNNALESPFCELGRHSHILLLAVQLHFLDLLHHVRHFKKLSSAAIEPIEHFLREVPVDPVFLENCNFLDIVGDLGHDTRDEDRDLLLLDVAAEDLQLGPGVPLGHLHRVQQTRYMRNR